MDTETKERRRFTRLPVSVMIRIKSEEDAEEFISSYTHDLSLGGMFLKTLAPKPVGTPVCIQFPCIEPPGFTEIRGKVVYQNASTDGGVLFGMGIQFTELGDGAKAVLQKFISGNWRDIFK